MKQSFLCCLKKQHLYDSESLILHRKEFVAILLWKKLNWKFLNFVLNVHVLGSRSVDSQPKFSTSASLQSLIHFVWLFFWASTVLGDKDFVSCLTWFVGRKKHNF